MVREGEKAGNARTQANRAATYVAIERRVIEASTSQRRSGIAFQFPDDLVALLQAMRHWLKLEFGFWEKPEVLTIASALQISPEEIVGRCSRCWQWAQENTEDGYIAGATRAHVDQVAGLIGFAAGMLHCGWIKENPRPDPQRPGEYLVGILFVNFDRHNSPTAKRRALDNARKARTRNGRA